MAWENFPWVWNIVGVTPAEYVILIYLADQANAKGVTPALPIDKIMRRCLQSRRAVFRHVRRLEKKGFIRRVRQFTARGDMAASSFELDKERYFPKDEYANGFAMWKQVLKVVEKQPARVHGQDYQALTYIREAFHQPNTRVIYLVSETDVYSDAVFRNRMHLKNAAVELNLPIRRFECFDKPRIEKKTKTARSL